MFATDEEFFAAIDAADPDTFGVWCAECDEYYVGRISLGPEDYRCPCCGSRRGGMESPALWSGRPAIQNPGDDGGEIVVARLVYGAGYSGVL